jgi:hypothetical protein
MMGYLGSDGHPIPDAGCELVDALVGRVSGVIVPKFEPHPASVVNPNSHLGDGLHHEPVIEDGSDGKYNTAARECRHRYFKKLG